MKVCHSCFAHHVLVNTYSRAFIGEYDGVYTLTIQWGANGICCFTDFRSRKSLANFVLSIDDGRAKRVFMAYLRINNLV